MIGKVRDMDYTTDKARLDWVLGAMKESEQDGHRVLILGAARSAKSHQVRVPVSVQVQAEPGAGVGPGNQ